MARNQKQQREASEFEERVVYINRVSKTVKGGRRMSLVALVVVGDGKGNVGVGMGKSAEVPMAISKASLDAKKNMFHVPVTEQGTIPHEVLGHVGAGRIIIKPAVEGTGVIAGGAVRPLFELAGIKNVLSKSLGTDNGLNIIKAAGEGLKSLFTDLGADVVVQGGQTMNPSTDDILHAVDAVPAEIVFVLPNNKNIIMAAEQAVHLSEEKKVIVVPTKTIPQGISAMLAVDPEAEQDSELALAMLDAAKHVRSGQVTYAARDSEFDGKKIKQG